MIGVYSEVIAKVDLRISVMSGICLICYYKINM